MLKIKACPAVKRSTCHVIDVSNLEILVLEVNDE